MSTRRNICSNRWACVISGSIRRWVCRTRRAGVPGVARRGESWFLVPTGRSLGRETDCCAGLDQAVGGARDFHRKGGWKYGFQWWLVPYGTAAEKLAWSARGFGGQQLIVVPEYDLIVVFAGWDILPSSEKVKHDQLERILAAVDAQFRCGSVANRAAD
jgi:hypothetical protein